MIKGIDELSCINCTLCEDACPTDVIRRSNDKVYIAYPGDCCNCMACLNICPVEAIIFTLGIPKKANIMSRWERVKVTLTAD